MNITSGSYEPRHVVEDELPGSGHVRSNNWETHGHGFQEGIREAFSTSGEHEHIEGRIDRLKMIPVSGEADPFTNSQLACQPLEPLTCSTVTPLPLPAATSL